MCHSLLIGSEDFSVRARGAVVGLLDCRPSVRPHEVVIRVLQTGAHARYGEQVLIKVVWSDQSGSEQRLRITYRYENAAARLDH